MKWLFIYILICCTTLVKAQENDFASIDNQMLYIPKESAGSTDSIASFINTNYHKQPERCRAIYRWITYNIKYDTDSMYVFNWGGDPQKKVTAAMRRRKGVCENYTAVFNEIAGKCGIQSYVVSGYTKQSGVIDKAGHCWCAVSIDGEWLLCDPTWDEGYRNSTNYFLIAPALFIESHMPFDPLWQLLDRPITVQEFYKGLYNSEKNKPAYNYKDSVRIFLQMSELEQLEASSLRIKKAGVVNELTRIQLAYVDMQAGIIYEKNDMNLYNAAVDELNKARKIFNDFVEYRNNQFVPAKPDGEINNMLPPISALLISSEKKLDEVDRSPVNAQYDTQFIREELKKFRLRVQEQEVFLQKYLSTALTDRKKLLYN